MGQAFVSEWDARAWLPLPPSANNLFRNTRKRNDLPDGKKVPPRAKTREYKAWLNLCQGYIAHAAGADYFKPAAIGIKGVDAEVDIVADINYTRDLDNVAKPVLDSLKVHAILGDDRRVSKLTLERGEVPRETLTGKRGLFVRWRQTTKF